MPRGAPQARSRLPEHLRMIAGCFREHELFVYASAIAFRALVSLVPLTLLGLALLAALGLRDVWHDTLAPALQGHVTPPVFSAIDFSVERIFRSETAGVIALASVLLLWDLTWAVWAVMRALNRIHDVEETRPWSRRAVTAVTLALAVGVCLVASVLVVTVAPVAADGLLDVLLSAGRWLVAIMLLGLVVALLARFGPAERPQVRWASAGSVLVIATWIVASLAFRWYVASVANFETAAGSLTVFLVLTAYVFTSAAIFLVGIQLDELLREGAQEGDGSGVLERLRAAFER